ncbi:hypothetical protein ACSBR2_019743 [Camellia fascicularis]
MNINGWFLLDQYMSKVMDFMYYFEGVTVAIGCSCTGTRELMAAPGKFSLDCCEFDCKELFRANCIISKVMKGSPAEQAGILHSDVIVQCGKKVVESFLEVYHFYHCC